MKTKTIENKLTNRKIKLSPYVYNKPSISGTSVKILILLLLQVVFLFITKSFYAISVIAASTAGALCASLICYFFKKKQLYTIISITIHGMMIGMLLPESFPPLSVFLITLIVIFLAKYFFVNCVNSWINVICLTVVICWFVGRNFFPSFQFTQDFAGIKNPSITMIQKGVFPTYEFDSAITNFLNLKIFSHLDVRVPEGFISLLWDSHSVIPAFRFNILTIISSIILFADGAFSTFIPTVFLVVYSVLVRLFFPVLTGGEFNTGDIILALTTSGTLYTAVFLIQWFGTIPLTSFGNFLYAVIAGILAFVIVGCGTSPIGMCYTVLICNVVNLLIRIVEERFNEIRLRKLVEVKINGKSGE